MAPERRCLVPPRPPSLVGWWDSVVTQLQHIFSLRQGSRPACSPSSVPRPSLAVRTGRQGPAATVAHAHAPPAAPLAHRFAGFKDARGRRPENQQ
jgi:hypothetical protein